METTPLVAVALARVQLEGGVREQHAVAELFRKVGYGDHPAI
jgi:hypothetical protein